MRADVAAPDATKLYEAAVLSLHGGLATYLPGSVMHALADAMAPVNTRLCEYTFAIAARLYTPSGSDQKPSPTRRTTVAFLMERVNISKTEAGRACRAVEFVASLKIKRDPIDNLPVDGAVPTMAQVLAVVRSDIKGIGGWGKVAGWISKRKNGWQGVSTTAIEHYCQTVADAAKAEERDREALQTAEDEHPPADVQVVPEALARVVKEASADPRVRRSAVRHQAAKAMHATAELVVIADEYIAAAMHDEPETHLEQIKQAVDGWQHILRRFTEASAPGIRGVVAVAPNEDDELPL